MDHQNKTYEDISHNYYETQSTKIIYPPFDEKYYTERAKKQTSVDFQSIRAQYMVMFFGFCASLIGLIIAPIFLVLWIVSFFTQISKTSKIAYKLYIEDCKVLQNSKHY